MTRVVHLRGGDVSVVLAVDDDRLPRVVHWGADLGDLSRHALDALVTSTEPPVTHSALDEPYSPGLLPEGTRGFTGTPGLEGFRLGDAPGPQPCFDEVLDVSSTASRLSCEARDKAAGLAVRSEVTVSSHGVLRLRHTVTNEGSTPYALTSLTAQLPLPAQATEVLDLTGRWIRERSPQRHQLAYGAWRREGRHGRTGHDATLLMAAGTPAFAFRSGEVWGLHLAWSGDHVTFAERLPEGHAHIGGGELLAPGEMVLQPGEQYTMPWAYGVWSDRGLDGLSSALHRHLRARPHHPYTPRPVVLNTWEAVYFDHDLDRLRELATVAAEIGVERFVLDDGWFRHRRDDSRGLGDWYVDEHVWPEGLTPLIDHVTGLGMQFGLWVEPEMVNLDSDLARAHPDWVLRARGATPPSWRHQQVLDLAEPDAYAYVRDRLVQLLRDNDIAFLKWDQNRDLVDATHGGVPAVHAQTRATHALMDELRAAFPALEIESCSSGGARVDLEILERADRVWASDCNDPLERQQIQRWTGLLLPPELVGSHVGPPVAHTTGRTASLAFRAATALFGHFGIEWDVAGTTHEERAELRRWVDLYKQERELIHHGEVVRLDHPDPALWAHGVVDDDRVHALFAAVQLTTSVGSRPGRLRLAGLDAGRGYDVRVAGVADVVGSGVRAPAWVRDGSLQVGGAALMQVGLELPVLKPQSALVLRVTGTAPAGS
ncbi:MAG TPA: alpha-galactosidase, partial [Nocardioidaceae bacterium]|nr:alpha-galactosidase [Nocardioidaceae bacterium]